MYKFFSVLSLWGAVRSFQQAYTFSTAKTTAATTTNNSNSNTNRCSNGDGACFTGETLVATEHGQRRIDEIQVGDKVWAYNVETGETEQKTVTKVYVHSVDEILHLSTTEGNIDTTTNHPFYVLGKGWVAAGDLVTGDEVYNLDSTTAIVLGSWLEKLNTPILVYNLEVEDFHSYFVGDASVLVHNYKRNPDGRKGGKLHQQQTQNVIRGILNRASDYATEVMFKVNNGFKSRRFADVAEYRDGKLVGIYQIGKASKNGLPVSRESKAIADIMSSDYGDKVPIYFVPYNGFEIIIYMP